MSRKATIIYTYNGEGHQSQLLDASIEMFRHPMIEKAFGVIDVRNNPGRNYEGAEPGISFVGGGHALMMAINGDSNASFWQMTGSPASLGYIGVCAGSALVCPVQKYQFPVLEYPKVVNDPVRFKELHEVVDGALKIVPDIMAKAHYTSVAVEAEELILIRDSGMQMADDARIEHLERQFWQSVEASRAKKVPIFDAHRVRDFSGGLAHQVGIDSMIFDVSAVKRSGFQTLAAVVPSYKPAGGIGLDARHAFAFVDSEHKTFCMGGHPELSFSFNPFYRDCVSAGFSLGCGAEALVRDIDSKDGELQKTQQQAITMVGRGLHGLFRSENDKGDAGAAIAEPAALDCARQYSR